MASNHPQSELNGGHALTSFTLKQQLELSFSQVSYDLRTPRKMGNSKRILNDTCGTFQSGRLTAILGPSGAGKSSLLNVLAGFKVNGVSGKFHLNGEPRDLLSFRKMSSYIAQDFVTLSLLTVEESLQVSANLKLPTTTTQLEKQKIVDDIIELLNLEKCRRTLVSNISGGEHKRLSIGIELVTNPPIMFFDEPTSGLDSVASFQVMSHLQSLARGGRIVVCVVHQPSSRLMQLFDDVLVLSQGELLYGGPQLSMLDAFSQAGFICPNFYNPADFVLEVCSEAAGSPRESLIESNKKRHGLSAGKFHRTDHTENSALIGTQIEVEQPQQEILDITQVRPKEQVNFCCQLKVLIGRHFRTMSRNLIAVQMRVIMHVVVGLLLGIVYWQIGNDANKILSNVSCHFFIVLFVFFGNTMPSILLCLQDAPIFTREYYNGWYSLSAYYISKVIADLPMQIICPTLFIGIAYFMTAQPPEVERLFMCWCMCMMSAIIGHFIGVVAGTLLDLPLAVFIVPSTAIPFLLFSGFFIRMRELPWFLQPLCKVSFFRYILEGQMRAVYGYGRDELPCKADFCFIRTGEQLLKEFDMEGNDFGWDLTMLSLDVLLLLIALYLTLHLCIRRAL